MDVNLVDVVLLLYAVVAALVGVLSILAFALLSVTRRIKRIERRFPEGLVRRRQ